jgi:hypothetical protein
MDSVKEVSAPEQRTPTGWHKYWQREKNAADKRLRECHNQGNKVVRRYTDERDSPTNVTQARNRSRSASTCFTRMPRPLSP